MFEPVSSLFICHLGPVGGLWGYSQVSECGGVFFRHVFVSVARRRVPRIRGGCVRLRKLLLWFIDWLLWGLCV